MATSENYDQPPPVSARGANGTFRTRVPEARPAPSEKEPLLAPDPSGRAGTDAGKKTKQTVKAPAGRQRIGGRRAKARKAGTGSARDGSPQTAGAREADARKAEQAHRRTDRLWHAARAPRRNAEFKTPASLWRACQSYFDWSADNPLTEVKGFSHQGELKRGELPRPRAMSVVAMLVFLGLSRKDWARLKRTEGLGDVTARAEATIRVQKFEAAAADMLNASLISRDLGLGESTADAETGDAGEGIARHVEQFTRAVARLASGTGTQGGP